MGKVRKLRKKFKALCQKNGAISKTSKISDSKKKLKTSALPVKKKNTHFEIRRTALVSETKNESLFTDTNKEAPGTHPVVECERNSQGTKMLKLGDNLPVIKKHPEQKNISNRKVKMKPKINHPRKQMTKIRQNNLVQDIFVFKKTLNEESFLKNPHTVVMNQTLERLSNECSFYSEKKTKNIPKYSY